MIIKEILLCLILQLSLVPIRAMESDRLSDSKLKQIHRTIEKFPP